MRGYAVRILNFDDSVIQQRRLIEQFHPAVIELKKIGPHARLWTNQKNSQGIKEHLTPELRDAITFLGSGDFHHISRLLIDQFNDPLSVIIFDHHPDWSILPPRLACGSWVNSLLEKKNIRKLILLGTSSDDLNTFSLQEGDLGSFKGNRLEIYPYLHRPSRVFLRRVPENSSLKIKRHPFFTDISWQELEGKDLAGFFRSLIKRLPTKEVYLSIDKDCLKRNYALTNWEEGFFELEDLLLALRLIKENLEIAGIDIVGDYSPVEVSGPIKKIVSRLDHPKDYSAKARPQAQINSLNQESNLKILEALK